MNLNVFTIVLDGMPWIKMHLERLQATSLDWRWTIAEGVARPTKDTSWVRGIPPRLSKDGTTEYLDSIKDRRVKVIRNPRWENKTSMCNAAISDFRAGILLQQDVDEVWSPAAYHALHDLFVSTPQATCAKFWCNYYVGPDIVTTSYDGYGNRESEWLRAWRYKLGQKFITHEPPKMTNQGLCLHRDLTREAGIVFDHFSWCLPEQVRNKCLYYGGNYTYEAWQKLQNARFPIHDLSEYLPWAGPGASADKVANNSPVLERRPRSDEGVIASYLRSSGGVVKRRHSDLPKEGY